LRIESLRIRNFKCFKDSGEIPFHNMTIFIGENDCGKSTILECLNILLNNESPREDMFLEINKKREKTCDFTIKFSLEKNEIQKLPKEFIVNDSLTLKKGFTINDYGVDKKFYLMGHIFQDDRLNQISYLKAQEVKEICKELGIDYTKIDEGKDNILNYIQKNFEKIEKKQGFREIKWSEVSNFIPTFESYNSSSYQNPQSLIQSTLSNVYRSFFYDSDEEGNEMLKKDLIKQEQHIRNSLNKKIKEELSSKIKSINNKVKDVSGDFTIDFSSGFRLLDIMVDYGYGSRSINTSIGEGSKKRLFLAIMEWDREIRNEESGKMVIRCYDEPDSSLHYGAQKDMFYTLRGLSDEKSSNVQVVICTHSLSMIDRASPKTINHVIHNNGLSTINYLKHDDDDELKKFIEGLSDLSFIRNSSLFFEKCYVIVEGQTEANCIPILYEKCKRKRLLEDGIVLINIYGNSSWRSFLKLMGKNKKDSTILVLDKDTQEPHSKNRITLQSLEQIGFDQEFLSNNVIFVGQGEFEDCFSCDLICRCLNSHLEKRNNDSWTENEINSLKNSGKFSENIQKSISLYKRENDMIWDFFRKSDFGEIIGKHITKEEVEDIPCLKQLMDRISEIID